MSLGNWTYQDMPHLTRWTRPSLLDIYKELMKAGKNTDLMLAGGGVPRDAIEQHLD
jgi:hypothetical protein